MEDNKSGPKKPSVTKKRRAEVLASIEESGPYSLPIKDLSEKWKCSIQTIYNDVYFWVRKVDISKINEEGKKLLYTIKQNMRISEQLRKRGSDKDRLKAIELTNKSAELLTKLMEQYGFKERIAEKIEHSGEGLKIIIERADDGNNKVETNSETGNGPKDSKQ
ncbi:hypothetical protein LCGC14_2424760 [marine sediment metagenome]|uniref:Helix-turn-helix type 11 domain-containing protein n=1 Tax=marine sediment metagenome TaxID=412755 RepID=A0A0F9BNN1_9ZZZZ